MSGVNTTTATAHAPCTVTLYRTAAEDMLLRRVRGEYREMPGMRLTLDQAMRLWDLDRQTCSDVFNSLVAAHYLDIDERGRYRKVRRG